MRNFNEVLTWEEERVQVVAIDGVTDEFALRATKPKEPVAVSSGGGGGGSQGGGSPRRSAEERETRQAPWAQWSQPNRSHSAEARSEPRPARRAPARPKTLFDLLFN